MWRYERPLPPPDKSVAFPAVSRELLGIISRRRELIYQSAIMLTAASTLMELLVARNPSWHAGIDDLLLISGFLLGGVLVFTFRLIQLHAGLVFNAMLLTKHEQTVFGGDLKKLLTDTSSLNLSGFSSQTIVFFTIVSSSIAAVFFHRLGYSFAICTAAFTVTGLLLLLRLLIAHRSVVSRFDYSAEYVPLAEHSASEQAREHYTNSLGAAHSDMLCVTTIMALMTYAVAKVASSFDNIDSANAVATFVVIAVLLGVLVVRIYTQLRKKIAYTCILIGITYRPLFRSSISDAMLGFLVVAALFSVDLMILTDVLLRRSDEAIRLNVISIVGVVTFVICTALHQRSIRLYVRSIRGQMQKAVPE